MKKIICIPVSGHEAKSGKHIVIDLLKRHGQIQFGNILQNNRKEQGNILCAFIVCTTCQNDISFFSQVLFSHLQNS